MSKVGSVFKSAALGAVFASSLAFSVQSSALALSKSSAEYLGYYVPGEPASKALEAGYINDLVALSPPSSDISDTPDLFRSANILCYPTCPAATDVGAVKSDDDLGINDPDGSINLGTDGWTYLVGKYDGPNGGSIVWFVEGLTGAITIPQNSFGNADNQYGLSHWTLFNPGDGGGDDDGDDDEVPEPGTLALVGLALTGLAAARRRTRKQ